MILRKLEKPMAWDKHNLTVTCDGYFDNGVRIHLVKEDVEPQFLSNAFVMCDAQWLNGKPTHWLKQQAHFILEKMLNPEQQKTEIYKMWFDEIDCSKDFKWEE